MRCEPIGAIHTSYSEKYQAPRQPGVHDEDEEAVVRLFPHRNYEQALADLDGFERLWLVAWFDRAPSWRPKVLPPRSDVKRGVFATRSPHRPNPIGISVVRLLGVEGLCVRVRGTDLLDGTPILDIKPYLPYADAFPGSRAGWVDTAAQQAVYDVAEAVGVIHPPEARTALAYACRQLAVHPWPHPYRRIRALGDDRFVMAVQRWRIHYTVVGFSVTITAVDQALDRVG